MFLCPSMRNWDFLCFYIRYIVCFFWQCPHRMFSSNYKLSIPHPSLPQFIVDRLGYVKLGRGKSRRVRAPPPQWLVKYPIEHIKFCDFVYFISCLLFHVWLRNRLISAGLEPVLSQTVNHV